MTHHDSLGPATLTTVAGLTVGHAEMAGRPTGCTVVLCGDGAVAGVDVRGGAPGTRELALLDPVATAPVVHAVVLTGGSAFGLRAADGVMQLLEGRGIGFETGVARVPIVTSAVLFDLGVGDDPTIRPDAEAGMRAARAASTDAVIEGSVGAGAGATVGKLAGAERSMRGGLGSAACRVASGATVGALVAVNAAGDVIDPSTDRVVAGARDASGTRTIDLRTRLRTGAWTGSGFGRATTLAVVATDARLSKAQATKVAQMAQDGLARTLAPAHTPWDGDTIFALATVVRDAAVEAADVLVLGAVAAELVAESVLRGVRAATGLPGLPTARDFATGPPLR